MRTFEVPFKNVKTYIKHLLSLIKSGAEFSYYFFDKPEVEASSESTKVVNEKVLKTTEVFKVGESLVFENHPDHFVTKIKGYSVEMKALEQNEVWESLCDLYEEKIR